MLLADVFVTRHHTDYSNSSDTDITPRYFLLQLSCYLMLNKQINLTETTYFLSLSLLWMEQFCVQNGMLCIKGRTVPQSCNIDLS